jgi:predicted GTPase
VRPSCAWRTSWLSSRPTRIVITGTPSDLSHILKLEKPVVRARYEFAEVGEPSLSGLIDEVLRRRGVLAAPPNH